MAYQAIVEAREAAEARQESLREAVRLGLQMKREQEERKSGTSARARAEQLGPSVSICGSSNDVEHVHI
ncbi:hypothetical protein GQR99_19395 [Cereibacter sphaeroides]|nr:hypothetical protein GQR99_19395 [Cereibacter sphaeroides]